MKKKSLARQFALLFFLFAVAAIFLSAFIANHNMTVSYHKDCVDSLRHFTSHMTSLIQKEGSEFSDMKAWFKEHSDELRIPLDFREDIPASREAFYACMREKYGGRMPGRGISFSELDEEAQRLYMKYRFEYWFSVFQDATEEFSLSYNYFIYPLEGEDHTMVYMFDPGMLTKKGEDGKDYLFFGDRAYEDPQLHKNMWAAWETGKGTEAVDSLDNEYGYVFTYCEPLIIDGEKIGLFCADASVDRITSEIISSVLRQIIASACILSLAMAALYLFLLKRIFSRVVRLEREVGDYSRRKDPASADEIRKNRGQEDELGSLSDRFASMITELDHYMTNLQKVTAEKERIGAELNVATQIQADMLPRIFPAFPDHNEFEIYATMNPAKEVGGDFYDFFLVDDNHLAMVMADVSGKGVPAALFMVIAKTLIKNRSQMGGSPGEILKDVNNQLCEGNDAGLFVTVWLGILEISTGKGVAANAGHEHPVVRRRGGSYELVIYRHSPAVATMEGLRFREHEFQLYPGDRLFVYTDGVPEATNEKNELYGTERMLACLNASPEDTPQVLLSRMKKDIDEFTGDAPQFDDVTMLLLIYAGPKGGSDEAEDDPGQRAPDRQTD